MFRGTPLSISLPKFWTKSASSHKILLKSGNWLLSYDQKTIFKMAAVRHLELKIFSHFVI